jgi:hypothetical protein
MVIGLLDLVSTAVLYSLGLIVELNPLMSPLLETHPLVFAVVKLATLGAAFAAMQWYRRIDERFVHRIASAASVAYVSIWTVWFLGAHL